MKDYIIGTKTVNTDGHSGSKTPVIGNSGSVTPGINKP